MIKRGSTKAGDFVVVSEPFHDYARQGDVFKIIDMAIPGHPTSAFGWKVDMATGAVKDMPNLNDKAYQLPYDKVSPCDRKVLSSVLLPELKRLKSNMDSAELAYKVHWERIRGLTDHASSEREVESELDKVFEWM